MSATVASPSPQGEKGGSPAPATFYAIVGGNDLYWRCEAPARALGAKLNIVPEVGGYYAFTEPNDDTAFRWQLGIREPDTNAVVTLYRLLKAAEDEAEQFDIARYPDHEGVAVWVRPDLCRATHAKAMRYQGIRTIAEVDDNYLSNPKLNIFMRINGFDSLGRLDHMKAMCSMNAIVFSTEWLRDHYWRALKSEFGRGALPDMFVCHNNVMVEDWPERVERTGPVRVGWMGSPSHVWDVDLAWPALMHARNLGCETWMIGYHPAAPDEADVPKNMRARGKEAQWAKVGYRHVAWQKPADFHRMSLPLDIGLCPLLSNTHTFGKSDVKFLEYTIAGAATIAQNNVVYNRTIKHGETGWLVSSPQEMLEAVDLLSKNHRLREELVANAQQYVREERNGDVMAKEWRDAVDGVR